MTQGVSTLSDVWRSTFGVTSCKIVSGLVYSTTRMVGLKVTSCGHSETDTREGPGSSYEYLVRCSRLLNSKGLSDTKHKRMYHQSVYIGVLPCVLCTPFFFKKNMSVQDLFDVRFSSPVYSPSWSPRLSWLVRPWSVSPISDTRLRK